MPVSRFVAAFLVTSAACCGAQAASLSATLSGSSLAVDSPCAKSVEIMPDASLNGQVVVQATADHQEELDHLLMDSPGAARITTHPGNCWTSGRDMSPTLVLSVRVPEAFALAIDESGAGHYAVGAVDGRLSLDVSGEVSFADAAAKDLVVDISGSATVHLARQEGDAKIGQSGHSEIVLDQVAMPRLSVDMSGAGSLRIGAGHVGRADLQTSGAGNMQIGAEVGDAHVEISGVGNVRFAQVTGRLEKDVSGLGSVTVQR